LGNIPSILGWSQEKQWDEEMAEAEKSYGPIFKGYASQDISTLATNEEAMASGQRLFVTYCSVCHGSDARGSKGFPNLTDNDWLYGDTAAAVKTSIMDGRQGVMPAWQAVVGDQGVAELSAYVYSLNGRETDSVQIQAGSEKYKMFCAACHMPDGTGNPALGAPNLTDKTWLYGGSVDNIQDSIRNGRNGKMPAHAEFLGNDKSHVLAAYVLSLSKKK
jgi:cytochrome c oxidase cbb3-type subunit 3